MCLPAVIGGPDSRRLSAPTELLLLLLHFVSIGWRHQCSVTPPLGSFSSGFGFGWGTSGGRGVPAKNQWLLIPHYWYA